jgi:hypothetical protein
VGMTPLHYASYYNHTAASWLLLRSTGPTTPPPPPTHTHHHHPLSRSLSPHRPLSFSPPLHPSAGPTSCAPSTALSRQAFKSRHYMGPGLVPAPTGRRWQEGRGRATLMARTGGGGRGEGRGAGRGRT